MDDGTPGEVDPEDVKQVIVIRRDLRMRRGKEIAQGAHASTWWLATLVAAALDPATQTATVRLDESAAVWLTSSWRKVTVQVHSEEELSRKFDHHLFPRRTNRYGCVTLHSYHFAVEEGLTPHAGVALGVRRAATGRL